MKRRPAIVLAGLISFGGCDRAAPVAHRATAGQPALSPGVTLAPPTGGGQAEFAQTIYVPITSSIATADNARSINLAANLTIRNTDPNQSIDVDAIGYRDSGGQQVRGYLDRPLRIGPLASLTLFVPEGDNSGGPSPSFLVHYAAGSRSVCPALVEAVMISTAGSQGITLTSAGRVLFDR